MNKRVGDKVISWESKMLSMLFGGQQVARTPRENVKFLVPQRE